MHAAWMHKSLEHISQADYFRPSNAVQQVLCTRQTISVLQLGSSFVYIPVATLLRALLHYCMYLTYHPYVTSNNRIKCRAPFSIESTIQHSRMWQSRIVLIGLKSAVTPCQGWKRGPSLHTEWKPILSALRFFDWWEYTV